MIGQSAYAGEIATLRANALSYAAPRNDGPWLGNDLYTSEDASYLSMTSFGSAQDDTGLALTQTDR